MAPSRRALAACVLAAVAAFRAPTIQQRRALVKHVEPAEAPIELCEENDELDEAPSPPPRRRNRIRRKLRRSTIGGVVGALGPWTAVPWTSLGILLPGRLYLTRCP